MGYLFIVGINCTVSTYMQGHSNNNKPLRGLVPRRELRPVELVNGNIHTDGIALPELRPALLGRN